MRFYLTKQFTLKCPILWQRSFHSVTIRHRDYVMSANYHSFVAADNDQYSEACQHAENVSAYAVCAMNESCRNDGASRLR